MTTSSYFRCINPENVVRLSGSNDVKLRRMAPIKVPAIQDKVCDICGDSGFKEMLARCSECSEGSEHIYCMQTLMEVLPENNWICERCKLQKELKCKDIFPPLLPIRSSCSGNGIFKDKQGKVSSQVSTRLEDGKVILDRNAASKGYSPSATPAKRAASDVVNVSNKIPKMGITRSIQQPVGHSASQRIMSKENSFKAPDTAKVKFLSPSLLVGVSLGGAVTVDTFRSSSGKFSKAFPVSPPKTKSTPLAPTAVKLAVPSSSIAEGVVVAPAESAGRSEGAVQVSSSTATSTSSLFQSATAKFMSSPRSSSEGLPSFLLSSKPPNVLKGQAVAPYGHILSRGPALERITSVQKYDRDASGGVHSTQFRDKLLARPSIVIPKNSSESDHDIFIDVNMKTSLGAARVSEKNILPNTPYPVDSFSIDQEMGETVKALSTSFQLAESSVLAGTFGDTIALNFESHDENSPSNQLNAPVDDAYDCIELVSNFANTASVGNLSEMSGSFQAPFTELNAKEQVVTMPPDILKLEAKHSIGPSQASDAVAKLVEVVTDKSVSITGGTLSVEHSDSMLVNPDPPLERKAKTVCAASADISEVKDMKEASIQPKNMHIPSCYSDIVPSTGHTRCYKCKKLGHPAQSCQSRSNFYSFDLHESGQKAAQNVTYANKTTMIISSAAASRSDTKVLEPRHVDIVNADFSASTASLSCELLSSPQNVHLQAKSNSSQYRDCHEAIEQHPFLSNIKSPSIFSKKDAALCENLDNVFRNSISDQISSLGKVEDSQRTIGISAFRNSSLHDTFGSDDTLQNDEYSEKHASPTISNSLVNIAEPHWAQSSYSSTQFVFPKTTSTQVQSPDLPVTVFSNIASFAPTINKKLLPNGQTPCSDTANPGNSLSERGQTGSEVENVGKMLVPFPGCTTFGVTIPKVPALPKRDHSWRGGFQVVAEGKSSLFYNGIEVYASTKATNKVHQAIRSFPSILQLEEIQRTDATDSWLKQFMQKRPNDESIDLYFFATDSLRQLLDHMIVHDLALKGVTDSAELFIFPSSVLPEGFQRWKQNMFLWGVFHGKKASKVDNVLTMPLSGSVDLGGYQASHVLSSTRPHVAEGCTAQMTFSSQHKIARDDMDLDMEAGEEVEVADLHVKRPKTSHAELDIPRRDIVSVPSQGSQSQQVAKSLDLPQTSRMQIPASRVSQENILPLKISPDYFHSENKNVCKLGEVDLPPGFGPLVHATSITSNSSPGFVDRKRINHENSCRDGDPSCNPLKREHSKSTQFKHIASKDTEVRSLRPPCAVQHSPPFSFTPNGGHHDTNLRRSFPYGRRYSDSASEELGYYKRRRQQEKLSERDEINKTKYADRRKYRDFGKAFSYRRGTCYNDYKETNKRKERNEARYWDHDKKYNETRMPRGDIHFQGRRLKRDVLNSTSHNMFYTCSHSQSKSRSCSPFKEKDWSYSSIPRLEQKSDRHRSQCGSGSAATSLESSQEGCFTRRWKSEIKRHEIQVVQAGVESDFSADSVNEVSNIVQGSFAVKHVIPAINGSTSKAKHKQGQGQISTSKAKDKPAKQNSIPVGIMVTEVCDSSQEGPAMIESPTNGLACSSENKHLDDSSKVLKYHLFMTEESSQKLTFVSELSSAAERTCLPGATDTVKIAPLMMPQIPGERHANDRELDYTPEKSVISTNMAASLSCEDLMGLSKAPSLHLAKGNRESSPHRTEPLFLFNEQAGLVRTQCHSTSSQQSLAYATPCSFPACEKLNSYETSEEKNLFGCLNLTLGIPARKVSLVNIEKAEVKSHDDALNLSLKL